MGGAPMYQNAVSTARRTGKTPLDQKVHGADDLAEGWQSSVLSSPSMIYVVFLSYVRTSARRLCGSMRVCALRCLSTPCGRAFDSSSDHFIGSSARTTRHFCRGGDAHVKPSNRDIGEADDMRKISRAFLFP